MPLASGVIFDVETGKRTDMALAPEPVLYYLAPVFEWSADSKAVFERITERGYKALQLYRVDATTGAASLLSEDRSDTYVDYWSHFWSYDDKSDTVYWTADKTGFGHVYAIDAHTGARRQITSGNWLVRSVAGIDESAGKLLIIGTGREQGRDPYLRHLYAVSRKGGAMKLLTPEPLDHDVSVSPDGRYFVDNMSLINVPTRSVLRRASDGHIVMELGRADISAYLAAGYRFPEPFETLAADGKTPLYGAYFKPADFDPAKRYPIIEEIYTGPQIVAITPKSFEAGADPALPEFARTARHDRGDDRRTRRCRTIACLSATLVQESPCGRARRSYRWYPRPGREEPVDGHLAHGRPRLFGGRL